MILKMRPVVALRWIMYHVLLVSFLANVVFHSVQGSELLQYDKNEDLIKRVKESGTLPPPVQSKQNVSSFFEFENN